MKRINKESIIEVLSAREARKGLHVSSIATHLINKFSDLFFSSESLEYDKVLLKVNRILINDVKNKKSIFTRVKNPKTHKFKKGYYKIKNTAFLPVYTSSLWK